jgi:phage terminase large subunit
VSSTIEISIGLKEPYLPMYESPKPLVDLWGGRGRGGSHEATLYALYRWTRPDYCRIAFVRKILNDVRSSLWKDFQDRIAESGLNQDDYRLVGATDGSAVMGATYFPTGNTISCFGVKAEGGRTAKLKSLAGYNLVIIEEANELTQEEYMQLIDSLRTVKGIDPPMVVRVFNPPGKAHWIWRDHYNLVEADNATYLAWKLANPDGEAYWKAIPKQSKDFLSINSTWRENVDNLAPTTLERWKSYLDSNPEYYFTTIEGLVSEGERGRIYKGWKPITMAEYIDIDAREIVGQDFGTSDPAACGGVKIVKNKMYVREYNYRPMTDKQIGIQYCTLGFTSANMIIGDKAAASSISKLRRGWQASELSEKEIEMYPQLLKGFNIWASIGGPGSIDAGIKAMKDLEVYVTEDSVNIWKEYREYKWALDKDKNPTNTPEDRNNHHMDWMRNIVLARGRMF